MIAYTSACGKMRFNLRRRARSEALRSKAWCRSGRRVQGAYYCEDVNQSERDLLYMKDIKHELLKDLDSIYCYNKYYIQNL